MKNKIYALHGFLGLPADWTLFPGFTSLSLYTHPVQDLNTWARKVNQSLPDQENFLIGYSLGGRLALHLLQNAPHKWKAAVIVSGHPGLTTQEEKEGRLQSDENWAARFEKDPWEQLMRDWNSQTVFNGKQIFDRREHHYDRQKLSAMLRCWSLGNQQNLSPLIGELNIPILWVAGEKDPKYAQIAVEQSKSNSRARVWIAPNAGHRVPWEATQQFQLQVHNFLEENS